MAVRVRLSDIVEGIESQSYERSAYLNRKTGSVVSITHDDSAAAESDDYMDEWSQEPASLAQEILDDDENYLALPTEFDIDEAEIMEAFCRALKDGKAAESLRPALKAKNPARQFKETVRQHGMMDAWQAHRRDSLKRIAREWCDENEIPYTDA